MVRILMHGCLGRMGRAITNLAEASDECTIVAGCDALPTVPEHWPYPVFTDISDCNIDYDVIVDFSNAKAVDHLIDVALASGKPLVCCTTALSEETVARLEEASKTIPVFKSANMSYGMNVLFELVKQASKAMYPDYDIEIVEAHHNRKLDAPSGSAYSIADAVQQSVPDKLDYVYDRHALNQARGKKEIGFSSIRGGNIVGEHEIMFISDEETVTISHSAATRDVFGKGAITAAIFLADKGPGYYSMYDIVSKKFGGKD